MCSPTPTPGRRPRPRDSAGLTLVELLIVLAVIGILATIAVPAYLNARTRAWDAAAKLNIRGLSLAAEVFVIDNDGTKTDVDGKKNTTGYKGMTIALLRTYDPSLPTSLGFYKKPTTTSYCARDTQGSSTWSAKGPGITDASFKSNNKCK